MIGLWDDQKTVKILFLGGSVKVSLKKLAFELVDAVKKKALTNASEHHPIYLRARVEQKDRRRANLPFLFMLRPLTSPALGC